MQVKAERIGDSAYKVTGSVSGASIVVDTRKRSAEDPDGALGPRPMELLLFGAATCPAADLLQILEKMRHPVDHLIVEARGERADGDPRRFTSVALHFRIFGRDIPCRAAERAVKLSVEAYCSALASLNAEVTWMVSVDAERFAPSSSTESGAHAAPWGE